MADAESVDLLIVGGGINGAGIARDAAGRGLKVLLVEQADLASATSSASTKLIHGGLRYLEYYEFRLVREALIERDVLLALAPHIIWPLRFVLPHERSLRPAWMVRLGLFLYDSLRYRSVAGPLGRNRSRLPSSEGIDLRRDHRGAALKPGFGRGFVYSDCWVEDSRLVVLNARDAVERGATVLTRTRCVQVRRDGTQWAATIEDLATGARRTIRARALVNAAGPWAAGFLREIAGLTTKHKLRLVKGSHIVVPRLYEGEHAYILQNHDRRVVFAIPYEGRYTLVGTTDVDFAGDPSTIAITAAEADYLRDVVNRHFNRQVAATEIVWTYAGVRPLYDNEAESASAVTRDYLLELEEGAGAPVLSVFGGKITTYRRLAEHAMEKLQPFFAQAGKPWTGGTPLPGGDMPGADFDSFLAGLRSRLPWLPADLSRRYARAYGTRTERMLGSARSLADLGRDYGEDLYEREVAWLVEQEWARTAEDILWRRSKLGLHLSPATQAALRERMGQPAETRSRVAAL